MKLPLLLISFLPKKYQERYIVHRWDSKTDEDIMSAYNDADGWVRLSKGSMSMPTLKKIAKDCTLKLENYILPQMKKRNLLYKV